MAIKSSTASSKVKHGTMIIKCNCKNDKVVPYQEKEYGINMRVHNICKAGKQARCTICLKEKDIN